MDLSIKLRKYLLDKGACEVGFADISDVIDLKEKSISFHETQLLDTDYCRMMRGLAAYRAESIGIRGGYVEWYLSI